jgi:hypothetical protein
VARDRRLSRAALLQAGAGVAVLAQPGAAALAAAAPGEVRWFVTRPDLRPPQVTIHGRAPQPASGGDHLFLAPASGPGMRGVLIVDESGEPVWFHPTTPSTAMDFRLSHYHGRPVLTWWEGKYEVGVGQVGSYVVMDDSYRVVARFPAGRGLRPDFHEFLLTERNTAIILAYEHVFLDLRAIGGYSSSEVLGGVIQELDIPSGRVLFEWRSVEHVGVEESYVTEIGTPYDYFHVNAVEPTSDGHLLVSARNTSTLYKISRASGEVIWRLGGKRSDFEMGPRTRFGFQHDARLHERGRLLSLFDNGPVPGAAGKPESRGLLLHLDVARKRATLARELRHAPARFAFATGNAQLLPNQDVLVAWGITGRFSQFRADGKLRLDGRLPPGGQNYRVYRFPWTGRPLTRPRVAVRSRRAYVTWNGATEVVRWELRSGPRATALRPGDQVVRSGFETVLRVPREARWVAAVALDARGRVLGTSRPAQV